MWRIAGLTGAVGLEVAAAIAIGALGGQWLDRKLGTTPIITVIGFLAGVGAAIKALVRVTREYKKNLDREDQQLDQPNQQSTQKTGPRTRPQSSDSDTDRPT